jgi:signal transduction histidine kinase
MHEGAQAVDQFGRGMRANGFDLFLFQDGKSVGNLSLPPPLADQLPELLADREVERHLPNGETVFGVPVALDSGHRWHVVGFSMRDGDNKPSMWSLLGVQIAITIAAIAFVGWFVARGLSAPLRSVQSAVQRIAGGELTARAGEHLATREDEIGQLARDVDRMAEHIQTLMRDRDRLLHDVSHELRAPMARLRLALELARSESPGKPAPHLDQADKEIERLDALVDQVLTIARLDQRADQVQRQPVALAALLRECADSAAVEAAPRKIRIDVAATEAPTVSGDAELLRRAVDNLLRNAIRYSPDGGAIEASAKGDGTQALITIADHGPGTAPADLPSLFQPFFRGRNARAGAGYGLGLAIVARVMKLHGGGAEARNRPEGGLVVTCRLPMSG